MLSWSLQGDRHTGSLPSAQQKKCFCLCCSSQISPGRERSDPRIARSPFGKDTSQRWQRCENVLSLLWALQKATKTNGNLSFNAVRLPMGMRGWQSPREQSSLWELAEPRGTSRALTWCDRAGMQPLHLGKDTGAVWEACSPWAQREYMAALMGIS